MYKLIVFFRNSSDAFEGGLDLSKKWFHIALHISTNNSSLFVDGELHKLYECNVNFSQDVDLNITLGGMSNIMGRCKQNNMFQKPLVVLLKVPKSSVDFY